MIAILVEENYKGYYKRYALTQEEFRNRFGWHIKNDNLTELQEVGETSSHTLKPLIHIRYCMCETNDSIWTKFFTDMYDGLPESDYENNNPACIDLDEFVSLTEYLTKEEYSKMSNENNDNLSFQEAINIYNRICKKYGRNCLSCTLYDYKIKLYSDEQLSCRGFLMTHPQEAETFLKQWSQDNPVKTRLSKFLKEYPNCKKYESGIPLVCAEELGYNAKCKIMKDCSECWNTEI